MKNIGRINKLYFPFAKNVILTIMSYRLDFFMFVFGGLMEAFVLYYLWVAIFASSGQGVLAGFTVSQMVVYVFMTQVTARLIRNNTDSVVGTEVREGSISMNLIKPINYRMRLLFEAIGGVIHQSVTVALPIWIVLVIVRFLTVNENPPSIFTVLLYLLSVAGGFAILFLFNFCYGLLAFFTTSVWGLRLSKNALMGILSGNLIPLAFFPEMVRIILSYLPFSSMIYTPVMIYLGKLSDVEIAKALLIQLMWIVVLAWFSTLGWKKAMKHLIIQGG